MSPSEEHHAACQIEIRKAEASCGPDAPQAQLVGFLAAEIVKLREALEEIATDAHCIAKAGPLSVPTLGVAWNRFMHISARATSALGRKS